jgi:hypothetical protein
VCSQRPGEQTAAANRYRMRQEIFCVKVEPAHEAFYHAGGTLSHKSSFPFHPYRTPPHCLLAQHCCCTSSRSFRMSLHSLTTALAIMHSLLNIGYVVGCFKRETSIASSSSSSSPPSFLDPFLFLFFGLQRC